MRSDVLAAYMQQQSGLFTRAQAYSCGYSEYQVRRRVKAGEWERVFRQVFVQAGVTICPMLRDRAATLGIEGAILAGPSAARVHGALVADSHTYVFINRGMRVTAPHLIGLRCDVSEDDVILLDDMFVTRRGRTTFDCLRLLPFEQAEAFLDRALQEKWTTYDEQLAFLRRHMGTAGLQQVFRLLQRAKPGARSAAERQFLALLRRAGITGWQGNFPVGRYIIDVAFPQLKLAIEIDGRAYHSSGYQFERDRQRQNALVSAGWQVLRFTWRNLHDEPEYVISVVRDAVARRTSPA